MLTKNFNQLQSEVQKHIAADQIVQGKYWDIEDNKGCFIGCLAHANNPKYLESQYGIPLMLTRISEAIFEGLDYSKQEHVKFFANFPDSVATDNKDLSLVSWKFLKAILEELPNQTSESKTVIEGISQLANGGSWNRNAALAAAHVAFDAADAAAHATAHAPLGAAFAAAYAADAAARDSAYDAAGDAAHVAYAAAYTNLPWNRQAKILLQLIKEAPVVQPAFS